VLGAPVLRERWSSSRLAIDPSGTWLAYATDETLLVRPLEQLESASSKVLGSHDAEIRSIRFSAEGDRLASVDREGQVRIWSPASDGRVPVAVLQGPDSPAEVRFDHRGIWLNVRSESSTTVALSRLDELPRADPLLLVPPGGSDLRDAAFDPGGQWLASADIMGASFWPLTHTYAARLGGGETGPLGMALAPDGSWVAKLSTDGRLRVWPLSGTPAVRSRSAPPDTFGFVAVHPDGQRILAGSYSGPVRLLSMNGGPDRVLEGFSSHAFTVAISPDGRLAAGGGGGEDSSEGVVRIWDLESGDTRVLESGTREFIGRVLFTSNRSLIVAGESGVREWNLDDHTFRMIREWEKVKYGWAALSGDRRRLLTYGMGPGTTTAGPVVHDLGTGDTIALEGFGDGLFAGALDEKGELAATGDLDGVIRVGPVGGGEPHLLFGHSDRIWGVAFTPDGGRLVSAGDDGAIRVWPVPDGPPFHTLPYDQLLDSLRAMTNYRAVRDEASPSGYRLEAEAFSGWAQAPAW
jgi:WD40 repeat protein